MRKHLRSTLWGLCALFILQVFPGCTGALYVRPEAPPPRYEERGLAPYSAAVWVDGYWRWEGRGVGYVWVSGYWKDIDHDRGRHRGHEEREEHEGDYDRHE